MDHSPTKTPVPVNIARFVLWILGGGTLLFQVLVSIPKHNIVDYPSFIVAIICLISAFLLTRSTPGREALILGVIALTLLALRSFSTAYIQFQLRHKLEDAPYPPLFTASMTAGMGVFILYLSYRLYRCSAWFVRDQEKSDSPEQ